MDNKILIVGTRFSHLNNRRPQGLSTESVEFLSHLRALNMWDDNGLTPSGDAFIDSRPWDDDLWNKVGELHAHFGLTIDG